MEQASRRLRGSRRPALRGEIWIGTADGRNPFAPPKKPWHDDSPLKTHKQRFQLVSTMFSKWCEMDFVHPQYVYLPFLLETSTCWEVLGLLQRGQQVAHGTLRLTINEVWGKTPSTAGLHLRR